MTEAKVLLLLAYLIIENQSSPNKKILEKYISHTKIKKVFTGLIKSKCKYNWVDKRKNLIFEDMETNVWKTSVIIENQFNQ